MEKSFVIYPSDIYVHYVHYVHYVQYIKAFQKENTINQHIPKHTDWKNIKIYWTHVYMCAWNLNNLIFIKNIAHKRKYILFFFYSRFYKVYKFKKFLYVLEYSTFKRRKEMKREIMWQHTYAFFFMLNAYYIIYDSYDSLRPFMVIKYVCICVGSYNIFRKNYFKLALNCASL